MSALHWPPELGEPGEKWDAWERWARELNNIDVKSVHDFEVAFAQTVSIADAALAELVERLEQILSPDRDHPTEWWCPRCQDWFPGSQVNYDETHESCDCPMLPSNPHARAEQAESDLSAAREETKKWEWVARHADRPSLMDRPSLCERDQRAVDFILARYDQQKGGEG